MIDRFRPSLQSAWVLVNNPLSMSLILHTMLLGAEARARTVFPRSSPSRTMPTVGPAVRLEPHVDRRVHLFALDLELHRAAPHASQGQFFRAFFFFSLFSFSLRHTPPHTTTHHHGPPTSALCTHARPVFKAQACAVSGTALAP